MSERQPPSPEEQTRQQTEMQSQGAAVNAAIEQAMREDEISREDILDRLREADVGGEIAGDLGELLGPHFSGVYPIANRTREDQIRNTWINENEKEREIASRNPGRLCTGAIRELANGTHQHPDRHANRPLTSDETRQMREAFRAKTAFQSLGKGGEGLSAVTDMTVLTEHKQRSQDDDASQSRTRRAIQKVFS